MGWTQLVLTYFPGLSAAQALRVLLTCTAFPAASQEVCRRQLEECSRKSGGNHQQACEMAARDLRKALEAAGLKALVAKHNSEIEQVELKLKTMGL